MINQMPKFIGVATLFLCSAFIASSSLAQETKNQKNEMKMLQEHLDMKDAEKIKKNLDKFREALTNADRDLALKHLSPNFTAFGQNHSISKSFILGQFLEQVSAQLKQQKSDGFSITSVRKVNNKVLIDFDSLELTIDKNGLIANIGQKEDSPMADNPKKNNSEPNSNNEASAVRSLVTITHTGPETWRFHYQFSRPIRSLFFGPHTKSYHRRNWKMPKEFQMVVEGPYSFLERKDGKEFKQFEVDVKTYHKFVTYAPQPFLAFEHGAAVNTYSLGLATRIGKSKSMFGYDPEYRFVGFRDELVIIPGKKVGFQGKVKPPTQGMFVFFGKRKGILETENTLSVVDADFPESLIGPYVKISSTVVDLYNRKLGKSIPSKLNILLTFRPSATKFGLAGGAQGDAIAANAYGPIESSLSKKLPTVLKKLRLFLAHEIGHIWQQGLGNDDARWFNEGEAELLSLTACHELGYLSKKQIAKNLTNRIKPCLAGLKKSSLVESHIKGVPENNYDGGALVLTAAVASLSADGEPNDVFDLDVELKKFPKEEALLKPLKTFQSALKKLGAKEEAVDAISAFITKKHDDPKNALIQMFDATGLKYTITDGSISISEDSLPLLPNTPTGKERKSKKPRH